MCHFIPILWKYLSDYNSGPLFTRILYLNLKSPTGNKIMVEFFFILLKKNFLELNKAFSLRWTLALLVIKNSEWIYLKVNCVNPKYWPFGKKTHWYFVISSPSIWTLTKLLQGWLGLIIKMLIPLCLREDNSCSGKIVHLSQWLLVIKEDVGKRIYLLLVKDIKSGFSFQFALWSGERDLSEGEVWKNEWMKWNTSCWLVIDKVNEERGKLLFWCELGVKCLVV